MAKYRNFPSYREWMHHNCNQDTHEQGVPAPEPTSTNGGLQARQAKAIREERAQKSTERRKRGAYHQRAKP